MGEHLVRMELYMILSSLLHQFKIVFPPGDKPPLAGNRNVTASPKNFQICAIPLT